MNETPMPTQSVTQIDPLAERYRAAFDKTVRIQKQSEAVRAEWIEATLEFAAVVLEARNQYPDHRAFKRWHERNGLQTMTEGERAALLGFARDPVAGRKLLEESRFSTWRGVWESVPKGKQRTPSGFGWGAPRPHSRKSGSRDRRRAARIPDVMQDKPRPPDVVRIKGLTREEVDPDFKGTDLEYRTKYGHVTLHTKDEIEQDKRAVAAAKWVGEVTAHARTADAITARPEGVAEWLAKPGKAARLKALLASIRRAADLLEPDEQMSTSPDLLCASGQDGRAPRMSDSQA